MTTSSRALPDLSAGVAATLAAVPLAIALGVASIPFGVAVEARINPAFVGLTTAIVGAIAFAFERRSPAAGPSALLAVSLYAVAFDHGYLGLTAVTALAGLAVLALGLTRLASALRAAPASVVAGLFAAVAIILGLGQFRDLLGLRMGSVPPDFLGKGLAYLTHIHTIHTPTAALGLGAVALLIVWPRSLGRWLPGSLIVLVLAALANRALNLGAETIGERYLSARAPLLGPRSLFPPDLRQLKDFVAPSLALALLICLAAARDAAPDRRALGLAAANVFAPMLGGFASTTPIRPGSDEAAPLARLVLIVLLLAALLLAPPLIAHVPLAAVAAVVIGLAWSLAGVGAIPGLLRSGRTDAAAFLAILGLTLLAGVVLGTLAAVVIAALMVLRRSAPPA